MVLTLFGVSVIIFLLVRLLPGDIVDIQTSGDLGGGASAASREELRHQLGLADPLPVQYVHWIGGLFGGDAGASLRSGEPVLTLLGRALPITLELVVLGVFFALVVGVPIGMLSAARRGRLSDDVTRGFAMVAISLPSFWLATLVLLVTSTVFHWTPSSAYVLPWSDLLSNLEQMVLPALCVSVYLMAMVMRMLRATMLEVLGEDYVRTARAKGVAWRRVVTGHALRNALIPVITVVAFEIGVLLGGTALIEVVFGLPGISNTLVQAIFNRDYTVIQTVTMLLATTFVVLNLVADVLYAVIDPRVQLR
jgi:peptide/nickel transport system permease protein